MTNIDSAIAHASDLFEGSPWLRDEHNSDSRVPGCKDLTWGELSHLLDAAKARSIVRPREQSKSAVDQIVADLSDRKGLRHEWDQIDEDIQSEIKSIWQDIVFEAIVIA